ncbi:hypothetical protein BT67DRAFT_193919 [Trichocladium antarcticum]|uniref:Uncharacterized protein n=1 Tax=Trichocladium antarcticum TaxID=1450529 RepID=A0AAN6ZGE2_9PEZI|nr:hypothetical protein BT67DRAFT_193919 [Trichocladium antarcticum]
MVWARPTTLVSCTSSGTLLRAHTHREHRKREVMFQAQGQWGCGRRTAMASADTDVLAAKCLVRKVSRDGTAMAFSSVRDAWMLERRLVETVWWTLCPESGGWHPCTLCQGLAASNAASQDKGPGGLRNSRLKMRENKTTARQEAARFITHSA